MATIKARTVRTVGVAALIILAVLVWRIGFAPKRANGFYNSAHPASVDKSKSTPSSNRDTKVPRPNTAIAGDMTKARPAPSETTATVMGRVYDKESGAGVAGVEVFAHQGPSTVSSSDGSYQLTGLKAGENMIGRGATGHYAYPLNEEYKRIQITEGATLRDMDFPLVPAVEISGVVVDGEGKRLGGLQLAYGHHNTLMKIETTSNEDGSITFANIHPNWTVHYELSDKEKERGLCLPGWSTIEVGATDIRDYTILVQRGASMSGVVVQTGGQPVARAYIDGERDGEKNAHRIGETTEQGAFKSDLLFPGNYSLTLSLFNSPKLKLAPIELRPGERRTDLRFIYDANSGITITGHTLDMQGNPLPNVSFVVVSAANQMPITSDADGYFIVPGLNDEWYSLENFRKDRTWYSGGEKIRGGKQVVEIRLEAFDTQLYPGMNEFNVHGNVIDAVTGNPVNEFKFHLMPSTADAATGSENNSVWDEINVGATHIIDSKGEFSESVDCNGDACRLLVTAESYRPNVSIVHRDSRNVVVALERGVTIVGKVLDAQEKPVSGALLVRGALSSVGDIPTLRAGARMLAESNADGSFHITGVTPDEEVYSAVHSDFVGATQSIAAGPRGAAGVIFQLKPASVVEGVITMAGQPVARGRITFYSGEETAGDFFTNDDGTFRVVGVKEGKHRAHISNTFHTVGVVWTKQVDFAVTLDKPTELNIDFPRQDAALHGTAMLDGEPSMARAKVRVEYPALSLVGDMLVDIEAGGTYQLSELCAGEATLQFSGVLLGTECSSNEFRIDFAPDSAIEFNVELHSDVFADQ